MVGLDIYREIKKHILEDNAITRWDGYLDGAVHAIDT